MGHNCWITDYRGISAGSKVARLLNPAVYLCSPTGKEVFGIIKKFYAQRYRALLKSQAVKRWNNTDCFVKVDDQMARLFFPIFSFRVNVLKF